MTIRAPSNGSILLHGGYPHVGSRCVHHRQPTFDARYPGALSVTRESDGKLALTVTLPFERYLEGIAEVPPSWPAAALQAQAVAARSFALAQTGWGGKQGATLATPICSTTSCQVYRGIPVTPEAGIGRWYDAVRATAGKVLLYRGRPADTVYFSTSNGHTLGNDQVFGSAPLPYLRPVTEHDDAASPEAHWKATLPFPDLARFLRTAGEWPSGKGISNVTRHGGTVVVSGHGASRSLSVTSFRTAVNAWAPCLEPNRYPPQSSKGTTLPVTVPSGWFRLSQGNGSVTAFGRGWGHGVGMVQWGAYGKAKRGLSAAQILAFYYGGLTPKGYPEPGLIHVEVASGLISLTIVPSAPGATVGGQALGIGESVVITGGSRLTVTTRPPPAPSPTGSP